eukprot:scaffold281494_cov32-Prasinocladus_malaysianus.AAC.2
MSVLSMSHLPQLYSSADGNTAGDLYITCRWSLPQGVLRLFHGAALHSHSQLPCIDRAHGLLPFRQMQFSGFPVPRNGHAGAG